jgi:hypothetical protein
MGKITQKQLILIVIMTHFLLIHTFINICVNSSERQCECYAHENTLGTKAPEPVIPTYAPDCIYKKLCASWLVFSR